MILLLLIGYCCREERARRVNHTHNSGRRYQTQRTQSSQAHGKAADPCLKAGACIITIIVHGSTVSTPILFAVVGLPRFNPTPSYRYYSSSTADVHTCFSCQLQYVYQVLLYKTSTFLLHSSSISRKK